MCVCVPCVCSCVGSVGSTQLLMAKIVVADSGFRFIAGASVEKMNQRTKASSFRDLCELLVAMSAEDLESVGGFMTVLCPGQALYIPPGYISAETPCSKHSTVAFWPVLLPCSVDFASAADTAWKLIECDMKILQKQKGSAADNQATQADLITLKKMQMQSEVTRELLKWAQNIMKPDDAAAAKALAAFQSPIPALDQDQVPEQD